VKQAKAILVEAKADPHSLDKVDFLSLVHDFTVVNVSRYGGKPIEADVEVIAIGTDPAWVDLPGEIFVELRKVVKNDSVFRTTDSAVHRGMWRDARRGRDRSSGRGV
jgi:hypothetical protein